MAPEKSCILPHSLGMNILYQSEPMNMDGTAGKQNSKNDNTNMLHRTVFAGKRELDRFEKKNLAAWISWRERSLPISKQGSLYKHGVKAGGDACPCSVQPSPGRTSGR